MTIFLISTRNAHKVDEIRAVLGEQFQYLTLQQFPNAPSVVEDAPSFAGNAAKKSVELAHWLMRRPTELVGKISVTEKSKLFVLADDSGLEVDALNGAPGVHSARFAALDQGGQGQGNSKDADNNAKLLRLLADVPAEKRTARFRCMIALTPVLLGDIPSASPVCSADEAELQTQIFDGACEGRIIDAPRGAKGFGYDPLFVPEGFDQSFAELGEPIKNQISHRAHALQKLKAWLTR